MLARLGDVWEEEFVGEEPKDDIEPNIGEANNDEIAFKEQVKAILLHHHGVDLF
jgi:hypothetical protein